MKKIYKSYSTNGTRDIAKKFVSLDINDCKVVCLYGELGTGKTTFVKGIAEALCVKTRIISPTYILVRKHKIPDGNAFYHIDAYRISDLEKKDVNFLGEILEEEGAVTVIEWADKIHKILPLKRIDIRFEYLDEKYGRKITFNKR